MVSTIRTPHQATRGNAGQVQKLDLNELRKMGFTIVSRDDGHVSIRPPGDSQAMLSHWAASRPGLFTGGPVHVLTRMVEMAWKGSEKVGPSPMK